MGSSFFGEMPTSSGSQVLFPSPQAMFGVSCGLSPNPHVSVAESLISPRSLTRAGFQGWVSWAEEEGMRPWPLTWKALLLSSSLLGLFSLDLSGCEALCGQWVPPGDVHASFRIPPGTGRPPYVTALHQRRTLSLTSSESCSSPCGHPTTSSSQVPLPGGWPSSLGFQSF